MTTAQYYALQQKGCFEGIVVNCDNTTANDGGYDIRLSCSEWKSFQANMSDSSSPGGTAAKLSIKQDTSGSLLLFVLSV